MLAVNSQISIPDAELRLSFSRSSGPGGQNVNKVNSKATLHWQASSSPSLPADVRARFVQKYASRLTNDGEIVIASQESRDQPKNIASCYEKLREMILAVAKPPKKRRPTRPTLGSKTRRLKAKKQRSQVKEHRRAGGRDE